MSRPIKTDGGRRECGACQACCFSCPVVPLNKPADTRCEHQCAAGCAIYAKRPRPCAVFRCSWLEGNMPAGMRPDQCGVMFETMYVERPGLPEDRFYIFMGVVVDAEKMAENLHVLQGAMRPGRVLVVGENLVIGGNVEMVLLARYMNEWRGQGGVVVATPDGINEIVL